MKDRSFCLLREPHRALFSHLRRDSRDATISGRQFGRTRIVERSLSTSKHS